MLMTYLTGLSRDGAATPQPMLDVAPAAHSFKSSICVPGVPPSAGRA
jgi:hypothetical protein